MPEILDSVMLVSALTVCSWFHFSAEHKGSPSCLEKAWLKASELDDDGRFIYWLYFASEVHKETSNLEIRRFARQLSNIYWFPVVKTKEGRYHIPWVDGLWRKELIPRELEHELRLNIPPPLDNDQDFTNYRIAMENAIPLLVQRYGILVTTWMLYQAYEAELEWIDKYWRKNNQNSNSDDQPNQPTS